MKIHELKCWPDLFWQAENGAMTAEFRKNDREFAEGDLIDLMEYVPTREEWVAQRGNDEEFGFPEWAEDGTTGKTTGDHCWLQITHIKDSSFGFGIPEGYVVLSVKRVKFVSA